MKQFSEAIKPRFWKFILPGLWILWGLVLTYAYSPRGINLLELFIDFYNFTNWIGFISIFIGLYLVSCIIHLIIIFIKKE